MESQLITPKTMTIQQCLDVIESQDFSNLIGTIESEVLEFKGDLYKLDLEKEKFELTKDVSALANLSGGIIILGVGTSPQEEHPHEMIDRIRPFDKSLINTKQYEDVIGSWIYPKINTKIKWISSQTESQKGIAYILIPESEVGKKPFLVTKILEENNKVFGNVVGFFQRRGDKIVNWSAEELHHAFKDGVRFDEHLSGISEMLGELLSQRKTLDSHGIEQETIERRITNAIEAVGFSDNTSYVLLSYPETTVGIAGLFESRTSDVVKLIDDPPELRYAGFDITTGERSRIINGEFRRSVLKSYKLLDVWRDGTMVSISNGDEGFLCWGDYSKAQFLRINTIALIESTYLFSLLVKKVFEQGQAPDCIVSIKLQIKNIPQEKKYGLSKAIPGSMQWKFNFDREIGWTTERNLSVSYAWSWRDTRPENAAYELVSELYTKFGHEHENIPYTKEENGIKVIDLEKIKALQ